MKVFIYQWHVSDEEDDNDQEVCKIRAYGINEKHETVCIHIQGFMPWLFLEVKTPMSSWTDYKNMVKNKVLERFRGPIHKTFSIMYKKKLYFHQEDRMSPFFKVYFPSNKSRKNAFYRLQRHTTSLLGRKMEFLCHEHDASPLLQMTCRQDLPTAGWVEIQGKKQPERAKITRLDHEYTTDFTHLSRVNDDGLGVPPVVIMSFDIETYSTNPNRMPDASVPGDCVFQISCAVEHQDGSVSKHLLTLGSIDLGKKIDVRCFASEVDLLMGFQEFLRETDPHVVIGYNIFGFDIPYLVGRARFHNVLGRFDIWGFPFKKHSPEKEIRWSSSAYSYQNFRYLDAEGRVFVDLLPVVKREYKFSNYKLKTVSTFFLGDTKDPLTHHDIFDAYREGVLGNQKKKLADCGKYCVQDAHLVLRLFKVLETWIGLIEMAKICNVPIMSLFTQGQQIKVFSQVYKKCVSEGILVQCYQSLPKVAELEDVDSYSGAYVFPPKPGVYDWVIPFDFSSLYPTTIIAYNIDYSTLVIDDSLPDDQCHIIEWEDHIGCEHDTDKTKKERTVCKKYRFRFRKEPMGVIPSLLQALLSQRSETKKRLKSTSDTTLRTVLDKRQLAYKVSANSMYGAMGVKRGYLPFMPGAMSTTAMGRMSIQKAAAFVKRKHAGQLIYGDSVAPDTPLYLRRKGSNMVEIFSIEEFFSMFPTQPYPQFRSDHPGLIEKEQAVVPPAIEESTWEIMGAHGWTPVKRVIRHKTKKTLFKIFTSSGCVETTEDHSLLLSDGSLIKPSKLKVNQQLLCTPLLEKHIPSRLTDFESLKDFIIQPDGMLRFRESLSLVEQARLFWLLRGRWPGLRFVLDSETGHWLIDPYNKKETLRGVVQRIVATARDKMSTVYDIETEEGRFHCGVGDLVVKNTDSIYCHFETRLDAKTIWSLAKKVEEEFVRLFPKPMKLVFEEKIYKTFLILTKKRYMAYTCGDDGEVDEDLTIRGVLLARRDNCRWVRDIYEKVVRSIMDRQGRAEILDSVCASVLGLFQWQSWKTSDFVVSKLVGKDYKIKPLPEDVKKFEKRCHELQIKGAPQNPTPELIRDRYNKALAGGNVDTDRAEAWFRDYIEKSQPPHVQLAFKMKRRGFPVEPGSRIEFLVVESENLKAKLNERLEDPVYFRSHRDLLRLDRLYYVQALAKPLDQLLEVVYQIKDFTKNLHGLHTRHKKMVAELEDKWAPTLEFQEEDGTPSLVGKKKASVPRTKTTASKKSVASPMIKSPPGKALSPYDFL